MRKGISFLNVCGGALLLCNSLHASPLLSGSGAGATSVSSPDVYIGYSFTVAGASLETSMLGVFDQDLDGLWEAHDVSIWTSAGTLLGSATVPAGSVSPLVGEFRYSALAIPVTLVSGQTYIVAAYYSSQDDWFISNSPAEAAAIFSPLASFGMSASGVGSGFPVLGGTDLLVGPNLLVTPIPEPSSFLLMVGGALILLTFGTTRSTRQH